MIFLLVFLLGTASAAMAAEPLRVSVYATAGGVTRYLATPEGRDRAEAALRRLHITGIFLEGRRGDEYVPPELLRTVRDYFASRGFRVWGGIATVPGKTFGARQDAALGWLNWESPKTRDGIAGFFRENAPLFDELIVDDFYCTGDTSPASQQARGALDWGTYRRDLLVSLIDPLIRAPARSAHPSIRLVIKYPQWYDLFHKFGYDPVRMSPLFDRVWVGTEVRDPKTRRMGHVQPTQGYINYRWISAVTGGRPEAAWFDHIECTAQNFADQAWQSVLAGAHELTFFHLGDVIEGHPGHALFVRDFPGLTALAARIAGAAPTGIPYYKPSASDGEENLFLMDYLAMLGLPVFPVVRYPAESRGAVLGVQAAADPQLLPHMRKHLAAGATIVITPALLRRLGAEGERLAGARSASQPLPERASAVRIGKREVALTSPLELDAALTASGALMTAVVSGKPVPLLTSRAAGAGRLLVWNVRTFSEQDYRDTGEWLLPPKPLGLMDLPREVADEWRRHVLAPLGIRFSAPVGVALYQFGAHRGFYNFRNESVAVGLDGGSFTVPANGWRWR